jgi:hyperosmotically inducible protein
MGGGYRRPSLHHIKQFKGVIIMNKINISAIVLAISLVYSVNAMAQSKESKENETTGTTVGTKIDDSVVTTRVKSALLGDPTIKSFDIAVVTRKGEVQLSGFVNNQDQIDHAIKIARSVPGVHSVTNKMSIKK